MRDRASDEILYCSVIGVKGLRQFRKIAAAEIADPSEFFAATHCVYFAATHCVYVEFALKADLLRQDRDFLAAMGHPQGRGLPSPIFLAIASRLSPLVGNRTRGADARRMHSRHHRSVRRRPGPG